MRNAKLNVSADSLASNRIPLEAECGTNADNRTHSIRRHIDHHRSNAILRDHINGSYLKEYLQSQHSWSDAVWKMINMATFGQQVLYPLCIKVPSMH
jgi:hypothetical protein